MKTKTINPFTIIGISVKTTNLNGQSGKDIGELWGRFMNEGIADKIPNRVDNDILSVYTNYESDHNDGYDTILGCRVSSLETIPEGMKGQAFTGGNTAEFTCKGDLTQGVVYGAWEEIWNSNLKRTYTADFEVYGEKAQNPLDAEVDIFVALQ